MNHEVLSVHRLAVSHSSPDEGVTACPSTRPSGFEPATELNVVQGLSEQGL